MKAALETTISMDLYLSAFGIPQDTDLALIGSQL